MGIEYRKKKKAPRYTKKQLEGVPMRASRLYRTLTSSDFELIMNGETFSMLISEPLSNNREFHITDPDVSPAKVNSSGLKNILLRWWFGLLSVRRAFLNCSSQSNINQSMKKRISSTGSKVIWCRLLTATMIRTRFCFGPIWRRAITPQAWSIFGRAKNRIGAKTETLGKKVYADGWEAKTINQLKRRIQIKLKEVDMTSVQAIFSSIPRQLRKIATDGPYAACSF